MSRIREVFREAKKSGKKLFSPYLCAGDPDLELTRELVLTAARNGADMLELGLPFSDPIADGPTVQRAVLRSLEGGLKITDLFSTITNLRPKTEMPLVLMTYYNPILRRGEERFVEEAKAAGLDGLLVVDLPPEEGLKFYKKSNEVGLETVLLATPTTSPERIRELSDLATGFIYYVMVTGVTGARDDYDSRLLEGIKNAYHASNLPMVAGFGVSNYEMITPYLEYTDGIVSGSAVIENIEKNLGAPEEIAAAVGGFIRRLSEPLHVGGG